MTEGATWEYELRLNSEKVGTQTTTSSLVTNKDGVTTADVRVTSSVKENGTVKDTVTLYKYRKASDEISNTNENGQSSIRLKIPLKTGSSWIVNGLTIEVKGQEDISTPAGSYRGCWKVSTQNSGITQTEYYANHVGLIKVNIESSNGNKAIMELTKFTKP